MHPPRKSTQSTPPSTPFSGHHLRSPENSSPENSPTYSHRMFSATVTRKAKDCLKTTLDLDS
ncbi:hypothetical protein HanRHA438_Chr12g0556431 [Helianthus annuus]|nr:hypothetical protein HanIR_Chr12g0587881 [Helianthus annuus]KAJ0866846.1 hypothetical protein HanRHA438_Chr12g0556431 [Helianthus annuus]